MLVLECGLAAKNHPSPMQCKGTLQELCSPTLASRRLPFPFLVSSRPLSSHLKDLLFMPCLLPSLQSKPIVLPVLQLHPEGRPRRPFICCYCSSSRAAPAAPSHCTGCGPLIHGPHLCRADPRLAECQRPRGRPGGDRPLPAHHRVCREAAAAAGGQGPAHGAAAYQPRGRCVGRRATANTTGMRVRAGMAQLRRCWGGENCQAAGRLGWGCASKKGALARYSQLNS
jgi:hypothetical protein